MPEQADFIFPEWPAPARVRTLQTTRRGGGSAPPWDGFNLAEHVGDAPEQVAVNRRSLATQLPAAPCWLAQVHGTQVVDVACTTPGSAADASFSRQSGQVCAVMTADCLPVLFCDEAATVVAAAHAGWRGLQAGILENTLAAMAVPPQTVLAWLGPAIGPDSFEVGDEVRAAFLESAALGATEEARKSQSNSLKIPSGAFLDACLDLDVARAFRPGAPGKWWCDLYQLARLRLARAGVRAIYGGGFCTVRERERFFSYRRDGITGRMASLIWLA
ncbi:peptidoglycan editing factor PgeF [Azonexus sp.]|uniref:peptidoglycan editing factor PgeF n=1 Tax=Azonexus sp. TaxID=1872668 RepID=UPI0039E4DB70